jgi:hypothetical protein
MSNPWKLSMWRDALFNEVNAIETFLGNKGQLAEVLASDGGGKGDAKPVLLTAS